MEENASPELSLAPEPEQSQDCMDSCSQGTLDELLFPHNKGLGRCTTANDDVRFCDVGMCFVDHKNFMTLLVVLLHFGDCLSLLPTAVFYYLFTGLGEGDSEQAEQFHHKTENVANETLEEPDNSSKANSELKKTWGFRRSTVAKREMPVEAATDGTESRCPVRRSGRQSKRTDKLEEFLLTAKRGSRKSAPPSLESGDPPSQTPTDAETASEASFDGNPDTKTVEDKADSPERRTRSGTRKQTQRKTQGGRQTRSGRVTVKDEGSSENEEDGRDDASKDLLQDKKDDKCPEDGGNPKTTKLQSEPDSEETGAVEPKNEHGDKDDKAETEKDANKETDEDSAEKTATMLVKRGQIRTYVNKKKAASKNTTPVKTPANKGSTPVKKEITPKAAQAAGKICKLQTEEDDDDDMDDDEDDDDIDDDENDSSTSSSSSSGESDEGGYDPNALYCICRQKHNKRYFVIFGFYQ